MDTTKRLGEILVAMDGEPFYAYRRLKGAAYGGPAYSLEFRHIQGSPGAFPASVARLVISPAFLSLPSWALENPRRKLAAADWLLRAFQDGVAAHARANRGEDGSGSFQPLALPQQVLERNLIRFSDEGVRLAFRLSLPGTRGGRILGRQARAMVVEDLPRVMDAVREAAAEEKGLRRHCAAVEDAESMAARLQEKGLVAFIADGAHLARESGVSDKPAPTGTVIPFAAPPRLAVEMNRPNAGPIRGLGIPAGVTAIVGGGFHGKSTVLAALAKGVYPHIPGDGRQGVATRRSAVLVRAEEGRAVHGVDISAFMKDLPGGADPKSFSTGNASGSTGQAASLAEALAAGARVLLIDEDTSAANLLSRAGVMARLVPDDPITPLVARVRELHRRHGVSTVIIAGSSSAFLAVADRVIRLSSYLPEDVTAEAKEIAGQAPPDPEKAARFEDQRVLAADNFDPSYRAGRLGRTIPVRVKSLRGRPRVLEYGEDLLDLEAQAALVDEGQVAAIGQALLKGRDLIGQSPLSPTELARRLGQFIDREGLEGLETKSMLFLARPRGLEITAAVNRLRSLALAEPA